MRLKQKFAFAHILMWLMSRRSKEISSVIYALTIFWCLLCLSGCRLVWRLLSEVHQNNETAHEEQSDQLQKTTAGWRMQHSSYYVSNIQCAHPSVGPIHTTGEEKENRNQWCTDTSSVTVTLCVSRQLHTKTRPRVLCRSQRKVGAWPDEEGGQKVSWPSY